MTKPLSIKSYFQEKIFKKILLLGLALILVVSSGLVVVHSMMLNAQTERLGEQLEAVIKPLIREGDYFQAQRQMSILTKHTSLTSVLVVKEPGEILFSMNGEGAKLKISDYFVNNSIFFDIWKTNIYSSKSFSLFENDKNSHSIYFEAENSSYLYLLIFTLACAIMVIVVIMFFWSRLIEKFFIKLTSPILELEEVFDNYIEEGSLGSKESVLRLKEYQQLFSKLDLLSKEIAKNEKNLMKKSFDEAIGKISMQLFHDLKSPLAVLEMACKDIKDPQSTYLAQNAFVRIQSMVDDLLVSRKIGIKKDEAFQLSDLVSELRLKWDALSKDKNAAKVQVDCYTNEDLNFSFSKVDFSRAIENILSNSIEAAGAKGSVHCVFKKIEDFLEVEVSNNGPEIPKEILSKLFKEEVSHGKSDGNGLGLIQVKDFLDSVGGTVDVSSSPQRTSFVLRISLLNKEEPNSKIIQIEDDELVKMAWKMEARRENITLTQFSSFEEFQESSEAHDFDCAIFVDYQLPGINGVKASEELKKLGFKNIYLSTGLPEQDFKNLGSVEVWDKSFPSFI